MLGSTKAALASSGSASLVLAALHAAVRERPRLVDLGEQLIDAGEQPLAPIALGAAAEPEDPSDLRVLLGRDVGGVAGRRHELARQRRVVAQHVREEDRVRATVRDPEPRADRVRERVVQADECVRERQPRDRRGVGHRGARLEVRAVPVGSGQRRRGSG